MDEITSSFLLIYAGLFPIVNPVGGGPIFLALTEHLAPNVRHHMAARVATNSFCTLFVALFAGSYVLGFFGITLPVVQVGGGLMVAAFAWKLLNGTGSVGEKNGADQARSVARVDAFYPLTMPVTVGPGSISVAITLGSQRPKAVDLEHLALFGGGAIAGLLALAATIFVCYRFEEHIVAALGAAGTIVVTRLTAFLLLCIGIQILWGGYSTLISSP